MSYVVITQEPEDLESGRVLRAPHWITILITATLLIVPGVLTLLGAWRTGGRSDSVPGPGSASLASEISRRAAFFSSPIRCVPERSAFHSSHPCDSYGCILWWLHTSSSPEVVIGHDGFLFLNGLENVDPIEMSVGMRQFSPPELQMTVSRFVRWRRWMQRNGIHYAAVMAPNKETTYKDKLPEGRYLHWHPTMADSLVHAPTGIFDMREALANAKANLRCRLSTTRILTGIFGAAYNGYRFMMNVLGIEEVVVHW